jgi:hypothetical protein
MTQKEYREEYGDYFCCSKRDVPRLVKQAKDEAAKLLKEFSQFYSGDIGIEIGAKQYVTCWSITGTLTVNGKAVRTEDSCDLLFLTLNELMLERLRKIKFGLE